MKEEMLVICAAQMQQMRYRLAGVGFADSDRNNLRDELCDMANVLHGKSVKGYRPDQRDGVKQLYEDLMQWMHLLLTSKSSIIPEEMKYVLKEILCSWLGAEVDDLAIVYVEGDFSVTRANKNAVGISVFETVSGLRFSKDPVFIRTPHFYQEDMLFNIALFHELGHVVDEQLNIFYDVKEAVKKSTGSDCSKTLFRLYFPYLYKTRIFDEAILTSYIKEYIADLFAAQYLDTYIIEYLDYIGPQTKIDDSKTHPHFDQRKHMVLDFIACMKSSTHSTSNYLLQFIMDSFSDTGRGDLAIRWSNIPGDDLLTNRPLTLSTLDDVFSIFKHSWDVICCGVNAVEKARALPVGSLSHFDFYDSFNKRVMESIALYKVNNP